MTPSSKEPDEPRRLNRAVGVAEALKGVLDSALKKRGFASRDIIGNWRAMAPKPYDAIALPDRLAWPRGARGAEGATLYLRCLPGHALALSHEAPQIAAAVNRYFGYLLVKDVRLSLEPFTASALAIDKTAAPDEFVREAAREAVSGVGDDGLKQALTSLGEQVLNPRRR
ncbi:MAG: DciA family protein [Devosia sp.]